WMCLGRKSIQDVFDIFMHQSVVGNPLRKCFKLLFFGKVSIDQQISNFKKRGLLCQGLYRISPVPQYSLLPVQKSNGTLSSTCIFKSRIECDIIALIP